MSTFPSILNQGVPVTPLSSSFHAYNSGTCDGKRFCSRAYDPVQKRSRLIWQRLHTDGKTLRAQEPVEIPGDNNFEDARVFVHEGRHHIAYTEGHYNRTPPLPFMAIQKVAVLDADWQPAEIHQIPYSSNGTRSQKNWQFFSARGELHFVYSISPHLVVTLDDNFKPKMEYRSGPMLHWPFGAVLRGGTPPLLWEQEKCFISFFHSHAEHREKNRRYAMGAYLFEPKPPFRIRSMSPALLRASAEDKIIPNPSVKDWNPLVVFPVGAWWRADKIMVALGVNDSFDAIAEFDPGKICWHEAAFYCEQTMRYFEAENGPMPIVTRGSQLVQFSMSKDPGPFGYQKKGYLKTSDPNVISLVENRRDTREIDAATYQKALR